MTIIPLWTSIDALKVVQRVEAAAVKFGRCHVALAGGVASRGYSEKDLDILIYRRTGKGIAKFKPSEFCSILRNEMGFIFEDEMKKDSPPASVSESDNAEEWWSYKRVIKSTLGGKRVDFIFII